MNFESLILIDKTVAEIWLYIFFEASLHILIDCNSRKLKKRHDYIGSYAIMSFGRICQRIICFCKKLCGSWKSRNWILDWIPLNSLYLWFYTICSTFCIAVVLGLAIRYHGVGVKVIHIFLKSLKENQKAVY